MHHAFIHLVVFHAGDNLKYETELWHHQVLAATVPLADWALEDLDSDDISWKAGLRDKPLGFYCVMFHMRLYSGKDADTPNGPGEYWTRSEVKDGAFFVSRLKQQDVPEETAARYKDLGDALWKLPPANPFIRRL